MTIYGYARVSTDGQTLDAQHAKLTAEGALEILRKGERS
jgi:DNA invertase Pin-like site-specific DNA recombinase